MTKRPSSSSSNRWRRTRASAPSSFPANSRPSQLRHAHGQVILISTDGRCRWREHHFRRPRPIEDTVVPASRRRARARAPVPAPRRLFQTSSSPIPPSCTPSRADARWRVHSDRVSDHDGVASRAAFSSRGGSRTSAGTGRGSRPVGFDALGDKRRALDRTSFDRARETSTQCVPSMRACRERARGR